ncbi:MAG: penicillin-binding protein 2 [Clostridia bacterium]|nr:penicillin-binding protein 2 [Clostridia bacterium]
MYKRGAFLFGVFALIIGLLISGLYGIENAFSKSVSSVKSSRTKILCVSRGYIYDRNLNPLVNEKIYNMEYLINDKTTSREITVERYGDKRLCGHLIGYLDSGQNAVCGIEKSYDDILLYYSGNLSVSYNISANDRIIGQLGKVKNTNYLSAGGIVLTVDKNIQYITEKCLDDGNLKVGAAVVMDVKTANILAMVSRPDYNCNEIDKAIKDDNSPLINRALTEYSVGSVFKPVIACAALEYGVNPEDKYNCTGKIKISDTEFECHKKDGHGNVDLFSATADSCNTFYINLTEDIDGGFLLNIAEKFGFGSRTEIADGIYSDSGKLPLKEEMTKGEKANFSFGQGTLMASPLQMAAAYAAIGNYGVYNQPLVIKSMVDENKTEFKRVSPLPSRRVVSEKTAKTVLRALEKAVSDGSGKNAMPRNTTAVGKTATAQSGWYRNGKEITHSWFIGMFPADTPKYVVVIIKEDGVSGSSDCAPIFKSIAELITSYE